MFKITDSLRVSIWYVIVLLTAISFTWSERLSSLGVIALLLHWLLDKNLIQKIASITFKPSLILLWAFFFLHVIGLSWSHHYTEGFQSIEVKLSFLILPLLFSTENYLNTKKTNFLLFFFSLSACLSFLYAFSFSYHKYFSKGWGTVLHRMNISEAIMHPGYYSNYFAFALVWICLSLLHYKQQSKIKILLLSVFGIISSLALLLLISKTAILFTGVFAIFVLWEVLSFIHKKMYRVMTFLVSLLAVFMISIQIPSIKNRIHETQSERNTGDKNVVLGNSTGSRIAAWHNEWELIKENWMIGYGTGEANPTLKDKFIKEGYMNLANENMHTHNQIFHTWLNVGIIGVILLFAILLSSGFIFFRRENRLAFWLVPLIFVNILTDDMLEIQAGIVFFIFFLTLFLYQRKEESEIAIPK